jgi:cephalosporin hydroxylase
MNPLEQWANQHQGNFMYKWSHYFDIYHKHFKRFRGEPIKLLEIGIYGGGSLQMWKWYFGKRANILGVDIDPFCIKYAEPHIKVKIGDQADAKFLESLGEYDIIIDDGGHFTSQQTASFMKLYDKVKPNGIYLIEDTHTSYIPKYIDTSLTFTDYCKKLIDVMHTHYAGHPFNDFSASTNSITFYDSVIVFEKQPRTVPEQTFYAGTERR